MGKRGRRRQQTIPDQSNGLDRIFVWDIDGSLVRADTVTNTHEPSVLASVADKIGVLSKRFKELTLSFCDDRLFLHELELSDQMHIDDVPSDHHHNHHSQNYQQPMQQQIQAPSDIVSDHRDDDSHQRVTATDVPASVLMEHNGNNGTTNHDHLQQHIAATLGPHPEQQHHYNHHHHQAQYQDNRFLHHAHPLMHHHQLHSQQMVLQPHQQATNDIASDHREDSQQQLASAPATVLMGQNGATDEHLQHHFAALGQQQEQEQQHLHHNSHLHNQHHHQAQYHEEQLQQQHHSHEHVTETQDVRHHLQQHTTTSTNSYIVNPSPSESADGSDNQANLLALGGGHMKLDSVIDGGNFHQLRSGVPGEMTYESYQSTATLWPSVAAVEPAQHVVHHHHQHLTGNDQGLHMAPAISTTTTAVVAAAAATAGQYNTTAANIDAHHPLAHHADYMTHHHPMQNHYHSNSNNNSQQAQYQEDQFHHQQHAQHLMQHHHSHGLHQDPHLHPALNQQQHMQHSLDPLVQHYHQHHQRQFTNHDHNMPQAQLHHSHNPTQLVEFFHHHHQQPHFLNSNHHANSNHLQNHLQPDPHEHYFQQHHPQHHQHQQQLPQQHHQPHELQRYHNLESKLNHERHFSNISHQLDQGGQHRDSSQLSNSGLSSDDVSLKLENNNISNNDYNNNEKRNTNIGGFGATNVQVNTTAVGTTTASAATATLRTVLNNHHKQLTQRLSVRFQKIRTVYSQYKNGLPTSTTCVTSDTSAVAAIDTTTAAKPANNENDHSLVKLSSDLEDILGEIDHYTLDWRKRATDCLKLISESTNCTNVIITRMPLVIALGHLICLGFSQFFDIDQVYSASKTSKEACLKRVRKRFETTNRCSYIIVGDKEDEAMAKRLDLPCWNTSRSDGHRQLVQLYTALKEGYLM